MQDMQNIIERLSDKVHLGLMTADEANVAKVRAGRVHLVLSRIPADVRKALNAAVKEGRLGHLKKDGRKPEVYFHPSFEYLVAGERNAHEQSVLRALAKCLAPNIGKFETE